MAVELRQRLKLIQQLVMTPQLQQAIKLLQLSRLELSEMINQELLENPVLEEAKEEEEEGSESIYFVPPSGKDDRSNDQEKSYDELDWEQLFDRFFTSEHGARFSEIDEDEGGWLETKLAKNITLCEHLLWQLRLSDFSPDEELVAEFIIGNLDDDGYLKVSVETIAQEFNKSEEEVENVLKKVQQFDPAGVCARNLSECLLIQLEQWGIDNDVAKRILTEHMRELERRDYRRIARHLGVSEDEVKEAVKIISDLEPRPGRPFGGERIQYITPDIYVYSIGDGYTIVLNEDGLPKLRISPYYLNLLRTDKSEVTKEYIQEKLRSAMWLIRSIHQRQRTIYRVMESIIKFQKDFFDKGVMYLKPLVLKNVAEDIQMHESTISRVTTNKYVYTPHGIFSMKFFFNSKINRVEGGALASESVKERIRQVIEREPPDHPYSDQEITKVLVERYGIDIARRTVTKYRESMGILSSCRRKQI